jgi:hypothetical protein
LNLDLDEKPNGPPRVVDLLKLLVHADVDRSIDRQTKRTLGYQWCRIRLRKLRIGEIDAGMVIGHRSRTYPLPAPAVYPQCVAADESSVAGKDALRRVYGDRAAGVADHESIAAVDGEVCSVDGGSSGHFTGPAGSDASVALKVVDTGRIALTRSSEVGAVPI